MLDIQFIRDNPELVAEKSKQKGYKVDIGHLLELDTERRTRLTQAEELRSRRNAQAASLKQGRPTPEQIAAATANAMLDAQAAAPLQATPSRARPPLPQLLVAT